MIKNVSVVDECVSCKTCSLACPCNAITYKLSNRGFLTPKVNKEKCINCGKCLKVCPAIKKLNYHEVKMIPVFSKKKQDLQNSSSGAVFSVFARDVLSKQGIVYGAAFDSKFNVKHVRVKTEVDLHMLQKSKYIISNLGNIFLSVRKDLENKKLVLFSGTPCQISALKKFLKKNYDNLYLFDLICHGNPSNYIWNRYLEQVRKEYDCKITNVEFRNKNLGWINPQMIINLSDGKKICSKIFDNVYGQSFLKNMILTDGCYNCKYTSFRQISDITLGDFWGYPNSEKYNGITNLIINTSKGDKIFSDIKEKLIVLPTVDINDIVAKNYPIIHSSLPHYNYKNYNINSKDIIVELKNNLEPLKTFKTSNKSVAILNFHYENYNYGAVLVAYSLSEILKKIGYNPIIIDFNPFENLSPQLRYSTMGFENFRNKNLIMTPSFKTTEELNVLNKYFDYFMVGSDQVWRKEITLNNLNTYFLDFVDFEKKVVSYGASFGKNYFEGNFEETEHIKILLKKFNAISVREEDGKNICKNIFNIKADCVLDPTLLLKKEDYESIIENNNFSNYVAVYCLFDKEISNNTHLKKLFKNKEIINIKGKVESLPIGNTFKYSSVGSWISGIKNSDFVVTDSYHGVLFSLIFNKEFICLGKNSQAYSRFKSLITNISKDIEGRIFSSIEEITDLSTLKFLNYNIINKRIQLLRKFSIEWLKKSFLQSKRIYKNEFDTFLNHHFLSKDYEKTVQDFNTLKFENEKIKEENLKFIQNIQKLLEENQELLKNKEEINNILNSKSWKITKPLRKISSLVRNDKNEEKRP